jgi:hypothetical protein
VVAKGSTVSAFFSSTAAAAAAGVVVVASGVVPIAVSILGASSETLDALLFSGDFERPKDLNWEVNRRDKLSFFCIGGLNSASSVEVGAGADVGSVVEAGSDDSATTGASPFGRAVEVDLSLVLGNRPEKILCRLMTLGSAGA